MLVCIPVCARAFGVDALAPMRKRLFPPRPRRVRLTHEELIVTMEDAWTPFFAWRSRLPGHHGYGVHLAPILSARPSFWPVPGTSSVSRSSIRVGGPGYRRRSVVWGFEPVAMIEFSDLGCCFVGGAAERS